MVLMKKKGNFNALRLKFLKIIVSCYIIIAYNRLKIVQIISNDTED